MNGEKFFNQRPESDYTLFGPLFATYSIFKMHTHTQLYKHSRSQWNILIPGHTNLVIKPSHHLNQNITDNTYCPHRMKIVCKFLSGLKMNQIYQNSSKFIQLHLSNNYFRFLGTINLCVWSFYYQKVRLCMALIVSSVSNHSVYLMDLIKIVYGLCIAHEYKRHNEMQVMRHLNVKWREIYVTVKLYDR